MFACNNSNDRHTDAYSTSVVKEATVEAMADNIFEDDMGGAEDSKSVDCRRACTAEVMVVLASDRVTLLTTTTTKS